MKPAVRERISFAAPFLERSPSTGMRSQNAGFDKLLSRVSLKRGNDTGYLYSRYTKEEQHARLSHTYCHLGSARSAHQLYQSPDRVGLGRPRAESHRR